MAYNEFTLEKAEADFGLGFAQANLFPSVAPRPVSPWFAEFLAQGVRMAVRSATEAAKSNFVVAPMLMVLKEAMAERVSIFAGVELNVDREKGLNGVCDFLISKGKFHYRVTAPIVALVEAKNDNLDNGLGQCVAEMVAAQRFNEARKTPVKAIYGVVTIGTEWRFLQLSGKQVTFHEDDLLINTPGLILGALVHIMEEALAADAEEKG